MDTDALNRYLGTFSNLRRRVSGTNGQAPHKPILLLAVLDEVEAARVQDNLIPLSVELIATFQSYWKVLVTNPHWTPRIEYPFRHLYQDGFWHFVAEDMIVTPEPGTYTIKQLKESFDGAALSPDLWELVTDQAARDALRSFLLNKYFGVPVVQRQDTSVWISVEAEKLKAEAQGKFRVRKVKESNELGYFVRHALFPRVVKELYETTCCACRLSAHVDDKHAIVDAAHILPFAEFHNDDPRNGLALCKNHHWGFDHGWFTITPFYQLRVSPKLQAKAGYVTSNALITLPANKLYNPDPAALTWHSENVFRH